MKKTFYALSVAGALTATVAQADTAFKTGSYVGANVGYSHMNAKVERGLTNPGIFGSAQTNTTKSNSLIGGIFGGYRYFLNNGFFIGGELGVSFDTAEAKESFIHPTLAIAPAAATFPVTTTVTRKYAILPALTFGKTFSRDWLGFLKVGPSISKFNVKNSQELLDAAGVSFGKGSYIVNKTKVGLKISGGVEHALSEKLSTRLTVSYERFSKISGASNFRNINTYNDTVSVKPSFVNVTLGVMYRF